MVGLTSTHVQDLEPGIMRGFGLFSLMESFWVQGEGQLCVCPSLRLEETEDGTSEMVAWDGGSSL